MGRRNQAQSNHIKPMFVVYMAVIGPILVSIDLIALAMAMAISAEQPVMPSSLAAKRREQGGTCRCCMCCYYDIVHRVSHSIIYIYIYIYIYRVAPLSENVQSFRNFHLKTPVTLDLPCVSAIRDVIRWLL